MSKKYVIDISGHQGEVDFEKVKSAGVWGVMLKCTEGQRYLSPVFMRNYEQAKAAGLAVGAYHYSKAAASSIAACREGRWFGQNIEGLDLELGAVLSLARPGTDFEHGDQGDQWTPTQVYNVVNGFAQKAAKLGRPELHKEGRKLIIYPAAGDFETYITDSDLAVYPFWGDLTGKGESDNRYKMAMYSHSARVDGVDSEVSVSVLFDKAQRVNAAQLAVEPVQFGAVLPEPEEEEPEDILDEKPEPPTAKADGVLTVNIDGAQVQFDLYRKK